MNHDKTDISELENSFYFNESRSLFGIVGRSRDFYELLAFVCWYVFLILCCIIPTACAYRRRRQADQTANAAMINASDEENSRGVGNRSDMGDSDDEISLIFFQSAEFTNEIRRRREQAVQRRLETKRNILSMKVAATRMIVSSSDLIQIKDEKKDPNIEVDVEEGDNGPANLKTERNNIIPAQSNDHDSVKYSENHFHDEIPCYLSLPEQDEKGTKMMNGGPRQVPDTCSICLCQYEEGDTVVWSSNKECQHVFHEDCILTWLVKKEEQLCPFCRQTFVENVDERTFEASAFELDLAGN